MGEWGDECQLIVLMFEETFLHYFLSLLLLLLSQPVCLPPAVGIPQHLCDRVPLSEECFVRSQGAPHIRGLDWLLSAEHTQREEHVRRAGERRLTAHWVSMEASPCQPGADWKRQPKCFKEKEEACSEGVSHLHVIIVHCQREERVKSVNHPLINLKKKVDESNYLIHKFSSKQSQLLQIYVEQRIVGNGFLYDSPKD